MTGAGLEEEGALEAGVAAMSSILGMEGLPRDQAAVANLMTGMVKAMGSIACLSEVCCVVSKRIMAVGCWLLAVFRVQRVSSRFPSTYRKTSAHRSPSTVQVVIPRTGGLL